MRDICLSSAVVLAVIISWAGPAAAELAAPHNAANNIGCSNYCHILPTVKSPYWDYSSADIDDTPTNHLCNSCHTATSGPFSMLNAPQVATHSSQTTDNSYGNWTIGCTDCHSPHFQEQLQWAQTGETDMFLATGRITDFLYDGTGETLLTLAPGTLQYKDGWDATRLIKKTAEYRRTVLLPDRLFRETDQSGSLSFQVVAVDDIAETITVKGDVTPVYEKTTLPSDFGIIYGQLIRQNIKRSGFTEPVKFFDNTADGQGGFTDQAASASPKGICQVCHTQTSHWSPDALAAGDTHYPDRACTDCHSHETGFAHGGGGAGCEKCHGHDPGYEYAPGLFSQGAGTFKSHSAHTESDTDDSNGPAVTCDRCHDAGRFPAFTSGTDGDGDGRISLAETDVCVSCHNDGTGIATGALAVKTPPPWNTTSLTCTGCHSNGPTYATHSPKANSHFAHSGFSCNTCHARTTTDGTDINDQTAHPNGSYTLEPGAGVSFTYTFSTTGGRCSAISCHGNQEATWGSTLSCDSCHSYPPVPGDGKDINNRLDGGKGAHVTSWDSVGPFGTGGHIIFPAGLNPATDIYGDTTTGYKECYKCHKDGTHANGTVDVMISTEPWETVTGKGPYDRPGGFGLFGPPEYQGVPGDALTPKTCSNIVCHQGSTPRWSCVRTE